MNRLITLLIALWLSFSACLATPLTEADVYKQQCWFAEIKAAHPKVTGASFNNGACTRFTFENASAEEIADANSHLSEFASYEPPPKPDYRGFQGAVFAENAIPMPVRLELMKFYPMMDWVETGRVSVAQLQAAWAGLKAQLDAIDPAIAVAVQNYAAAFHVPLVP